jgi:hypothetical protein
MADVARGRWKQVCFDNDGLGPRPLDGGMHTVQQQSRDVSSRDVLFARAALPGGKWCARTK